MCKITFTFSSLWHRSPWWLTPLGWGNRPAITTPLRMMSLWSSQSWTVTQRNDHVGVAVLVNAAGGTSVLSASGLKRTCLFLGTVWDVLEVLHFWFHTYTSCKQEASVIVAQWFISFLAVMGEHFLYKKIKVFNFSCEHMLTLYGPFMALHKNN